MDSILTTDNVPKLGDHVIRSGLKVPHGDGETEAAIIEAAEEGYEFDDDSLASSDSWRGPQETRMRSVAVDLPRCTLLAPRTAYEGSQPRTSITEERTAVQSLLDLDPSQIDEDFVEIDLDNFSCYIDSDRHPLEMRALHTHAALTGNSVFYFDGVLRIGDVQHYVRRVPFKEIPLGNYGKEQPTVGDQLWIRSNLNEGKEIYYKLKNASIEYARFHRDFLWVADLAKHVVDFCDDFIDHMQGHSVSIHHFKEQFSKWLRKTHKTEPSFLKWYKQRGSADFRQSIVANEPFIRKEIFGALENKKHRHLRIFHEIRYLDLYKRQGSLPSQDRVPYTIVTPYIYKCFSHIQLGQLLKEVQPTVSAEEAIRLSWPENRSRDLAFVRRAGTIKGIRKGDTISVAPDPPGSGTKWKPLMLKDESKDRRWYGVVQKAHTSTKGSRHFDITWMYQPDDTPCCSMWYPHKNELFLSDHCTCLEDRRARIPEEEVLGVHTVEWFGRPETKAEFFVRQTYQVEQRRFVTLEKEHIGCQHEKENHEREKPLKYLVGNTVLVQTPGTNVLEPFELLGYLDGWKTVRLRRFLRRKEQAGHGRSAPNELVYTSEETYASADEIHLKCIIRFYSPGEKIPAPYRCNGAGNAFFISHCKLANGSIQPIPRDKRPQLRQGFNPKRWAKKLRALDLFSGCGNFGRGLEEGGAVEAKWANDIWDNAVHTWMANKENRQSVLPFLGSIDDLNLRAFEGKFDASVPRPGEVDLISGGSPCPGFSLVTVDKTTLRQMKNRSLVAAFASSVDFWRPKYGILENVKTIVQSHKDHQKRPDDFFSQLICAIVGMGYQAQIILGDAWSHGSPQTRVRAFLYFAAPGLRLPQPPEPSHSNPGQLSSGGLGKMTNGEPYVQRHDKPTPFKYVTSLEATADLPDIYDAKTDTCIPFPDHRLSISVSSGNSKGKSRCPDGGDTKNARTQILNIPIRPYSMSFAKAWFDKTPDCPQDMFPHERDAFPSGSAHRVSKISKGWGRIHPHKLFGTVTTACHMTDSRIGTMMHWDQPRPLTIMEVRRAQGVPDDEVLLGSPRDQWEMVGNGVARQISMALGLALREAWMGTLYDEAGEVPAVREGVVQEGREEKMPFADEKAAMDADDNGISLGVVDFDNEDEVALLPRATLAHGRLGTGTGTGTASSSSSNSPGPRETSDAASASVGAGHYPSTPATSFTDVNNDLMTASGTVGGRKRQMSRNLAVELLSKRRRLTDSVLDEGQVQSSDEDPLVGDGSGPAPGLARSGGPTIVRLEPEDEEDYFWSR